MSEDSPPLPESIFGDQAAAYARYRPTYPDELFDYLVDLADPCRCALDCATGSGQAARALADRVDRVVATDIDEAQLAEAPAHSNIEYRTAPAEETGLETESVDLVTAAAALHWFDFDAFFAHLRDIVRPGGVIAAWTYSGLRAGVEIDSVIAHFSDEVLVDRWHPRLEYVWEGYETIPFPFEELDTPQFASEFDWTLDDLVGFVSTWSAVEHHRQQTGEDPLEIIRGELAEIWGDPDETHRISIPLHIRVGCLPTRHQER